MRVVLSTVLFMLICVVTHAAERQPNFVVIFCDDLGWGDLGCFGNPTIRTPNLDRMAAEGQKWTQFYVAAPVCTPSRAALMTGRYPIRNGMTSAKRAVLFPDSGGGLPPAEITLPELLKQKNYATGMFGKWHLGIYPSTCQQRKALIRTMAFRIQMTWTKSRDQITAPKLSKTRTTIPLARTSMCR